MGNIMPKTNPFEGRVALLSDEDFAMLSQAVKERSCRERYGFGTLAEAAGLYRPAPPCPSCNDATPFHDGQSDSGLCRFRCRLCGRRFNSLTATVLSCCKKDLPAWIDFINLMRFNVPLDAAAEICLITHGTAYEWRHRVFAAVDGYQDHIVLRDRIWIDETYVCDTDLTHGFGEARKRGLSNQQICIVVAIDTHKNLVAVVCGHGKPSSKRITGGLESHILKGSIIVHDKERAHNSLIKLTGCASETHKANCADPVYLECMAMVNNLCSWLKRYLWRFTGMDPSNLQSYLNWYVYLFRVRQSREKWPETERVVRHLMMANASYRTSR